MIPDHYDGVRSRGIPDHYGGVRSRGLPDRHEGSDRPYGGFRRKVRRESDIYYIVPPGVSVIFHDEDGNEITR